MFLSASIGENLTEIFSYPTTYITLLGVLILLIGLNKMKKIQFTTKMLTFMGLAIALTAVLKMFKVYQAPFGGSVTFGSMIPILLVGYFYGTEVGLLTGFVYGIVDLILGPYILHPVQVLFDYPLPFMMLGLIGLFKGRDKKFVFLGTLVAVSARFMCHYFAGVVFWGSYAPEGMSPYLYSLLYNGSYLVFDSIIVIVILAILPLDKLKKIITE
ncbi:energy-coupled thiamine transporter ThiT [Clostridium grantii]|uniref:Thiamine transporter n=1 Tax=Clostridium grantii DSM 8605 TaxID=1121316 RepID=A0A1M5UXF6_9CLOT|nr:energy-coupled thiamine transporter ThiT [Clostridium grantii]SHH67685.1 thiamine transporter [Clostridium grantii DSM 8605]